MEVKGSEEVADFGVRISFSPGALALSDVLVTWFLFFFF